MKDFLSILSNTAQAISKFGFNVEADFDVYAEFKPELNLIMDFQIKDEDELRQKQKSYSEGKEELSELESKVKDLAKEISELREEEKSQGESKKEEIDKKEKERASTVQEIKSLKDSLGEEPSFKNLLPLKPGKKDGDKVGTGKETRYWDAKNKVWLPMDLFNATRPLSEERAKITKPLSEEKRKELSELVGKLEGDLDLKGFIKSLSKDFQDLYKEDGFTPETQKNIKQKFEKFEQANSAKIKKLNEIIKKVNNSVGPEVAKTVKRVILRSPSISEAKEKLNQDLPKSEESVSEYEPKLDENKKEFTKMDRLYIINVIKNNHKSGIEGVLKKLKGKYNKDLIQELKDASERFGDLRGMAAYLRDYNTKKKEFDKWREGPAVKQKKPNTEINEKIDPVIDFIGESKKDFGFKNYDGSFLDVTERALKALKEYARSNYKSQDFENLMMYVFGDKGKLAKAWSQAKIPKHSETMKRIPEMIKDTFNTEEWKIEKRKDNEGDLDKLPFEVPNEDYEKMKRKFPDKVKNKEDFYTLINEDPFQFFYNKFDDKDAPKFVKDFMKIVKEPAHMELVTVEKKDESGEVVDTKEYDRLPEDQKELIKLFKKEKRLEKQRDIKEIRERGLDKKEIRELNKKYREEVKRRKETDLMKAMGLDMDIDKEIEEIKKELDALGDKKDSKSKAKRMFLQQDLDFFNTQKDMKQKASEEIKDLKQWIQEQPYYDSSKRKFVEKPSEKELVEQEISFLEDKIKKEEEKKEKYKSKKKQKEIEKEIEALEDQIDLLKGWYGLSDEKKQQYLKKIQERDKSKNIPEDEKIRDKFYRDLESKLNKSIIQFQGAGESSNKNQQEPKLYDNINDVPVNQKLLEKNPDATTVKILKKNIPASQLSDKEVKELAKDFNKVVKKLQLMKKKREDKGDVDKDQEKKIAPPGELIDISDYMAWRKEKGKKKKSKVLAMYREGYSIPHRIEKLASLSNNEFVKAELLSILEKYKDFV